MGALMVLLHGSAMALSSQARLPAYACRPERACLRPTCSAMAGHLSRALALARDPERWEPVFGKDHAQNKNLERDDDSKKNHPALDLLEAKIIPDVGRRSWCARHSLFAWKAAIGALSFAACCGVAAAQGTAPPPAVSVTPVASRQVTETSDYIGRIVAIDKVDIVARVPGFLEQRNFTEGQVVKKGDLLFRIEQATYKAAVEQAQASLAKAKATEVNAKMQLERGQELVRNQNIPQSTLDQRAADEATAQASVLEAQAALDQAQINLGYTEIRSPIDGRIGLATFTEGNLVQPSSGRLATIVSQDPVYVIFQASERDVLDYKRKILESPDKKPSVTIRIRLPNGSLYPHPAVNDFLDVQVDPTTDTVAVRGRVANPELLLIPGGIVGVMVERGEPRPALTVPQAAVQLDQAGRYVLVVDAAKKVEQRRITAGAEQGRDIVVTDGLKQGELVIVDGIQKVRPGQVVTATVVPGT